ncbi:MAG: alpha/beta hydrolase [Pirellulales bacterium]|nr:alpha/beta hydrolase [Pirellulales bacterium]
MTCSRLIRSVFLCLFAVWPIASARADEPADQHEIEVRDNVEYGTGGGEKLTLHLAKPKNLSEPAPAIVFIHGGGWRQGNKDAYHDMIREAARRGYVAISVGYRFAPAHLFPAQVEDVKCAVRWLRAHADELNVDPARIGATGDSAGGHLSLMLGTTEPSDGLEGNGGWNDRSSKVQAVVAYYGPTNFLAEYPTITQPIIESFLGGKLDERREEYRRASPLTYVSKDDAPTLIFHGTKDILVPYQQAFEMIDAFTKVDVPGRVEIMLGAAHGWRGDERKRTEAETFDFFDEYLRKQSD